MSTGGAAIKATSLGAVEVAALRSLVAALFLFAATRAWRHRFDRPSIGVGVVVAVMMLLYVAANKLTTAANTIYLQSAAPLWVLLAAPRLLGETIRMRDLLYMAALAGGLVLLLSGTQPVFATAPRPMLGNLLALIGGVAWAATIMGLRWRASAGIAATAMPAIICGNALVFAAGAPWALRAWPLAVSDASVLLYLGLLQIGLSYVLFDSGVKHVPAFEASLLLLVEPVFNPVWAWVLHAETPGPWALAGGAVILGATAVKTVLDRRRQPTMSP